MLVVSACSSGAGRAVGGDDAKVGTAYAKVGDCMNPREPPALAVPVDCDAPNATYVIASRLDGPERGSCPTPSYDSYAQEGDDGDFTLCLIMNGEQGDCFTGYGRPNAMKAKAPCAEADAIVTRTFDGRADRDACPPDNQWRLAYPVPAPGRTVCIAAQRGSAGAPA